jgi:hypothetical protein
MQLGSRRGDIRSPADRNLEGNFGREYTACCGSWTMSGATWERFEDLVLIREQRIPYLENANVDTVFLLKKKRFSVSAEAR